MSENMTEPINIQISREELLFVLNLLQAETVPGLDADPLGELSPEGRDLALTVAERALRARGLARVGEDGQVTVHNSLLTAVGVCAYSANTVFVYHWSENGESPVRFFGHIRDEDITIHTRPEDVLHSFTLLPSMEHLIQEVLDVCEYNDVPESQSFESTLLSDHFVKARDLASSGEPQKAIDLLVSNNANPEMAGAFVTTLTGSPRISILQTLKQDRSDVVLKRDFTILQNNQYAWLIAATSVEDEATPLLIKTTTQEELEALLAESL